MQLHELSRFKPIFRRAERMGSARILRRALNWTDAQAVPLSIAHGVDFGQLSKPLDSHGIEPLHWAVNPAMLATASRVKPAVLIPHPFSLLERQNQRHSTRDTLVIGSVPSPANDQNLLTALRKAGIDRFDILLKQRGSLDRSVNFWQSNGAQTITAGSPADEAFYSNLFNILSRYRKVIAGTLSSAVFFAASIGRSCELLLDHTYEAYEVLSYVDRADFSAADARTFAGLIVNGKLAEAMRFSRNLLGSDLPFDPSVVEREILRQIESLTVPIHAPHIHSRRLATLAAEIALRINRPGLVEEGWTIRLPSVRHQRIGLFQMNEISLWINGRNDQNFRWSTVPYRHNVTVPGWAPNG